MHFQCLTTWLSPLACSSQLNVMLYTRVATYPPVLILVYQFIIFINITMYVTNPYENIWSYAFWWRDCHNHAEREIWNDYLKFILLHLTPACKIPSSGTCRFCVNRHFGGNYCLHLHLLTLVPRSWIFLPWRWSQYVPPKCWFTQDLHGATSPKTAFFIVTAVKTPNLT
jgi:hypothetical protein